MANEFTSFLSDSCNRKHSDVSLSKDTFVIYCSGTSIMKLTFYHIRCFLLSKDALTPNLAEFGPVTRARATNLALNQSRIEILRVRKKLQNRQKLMTFWIILNLWHPESSNFFEFSKSVNVYYSNSRLQICQNYTNLKSAVWIVKVDRFWKFKKKIDFSVIKYVFSIFMKVYTSSI